MKADFFIVGGGLAGSVLAWVLQQRGSRVLVFDAEPPMSCSRLAAGIINPVTGKRLVKSWRFEEFLAFAKNTYRQMERDLQVDLFQPHRIFRAFPPASSAEGESMNLRNQWSMRLGDEAYAHLLAPIQSEPPEPGLFRAAPAYGCIRGAARLDIPRLLDAVRKCTPFVRENFDYGALQIRAEGVSYKGHSASAVVFCEGYAMRENPWFGHLPLNPAKGHVLHLQMESGMYEQRYMYKDELYFVPLDTETVWCGSDYVWDFVDEQPQPERVKALRTRAESIWRKPYKTKGVFAAVRPTVKDRRPLLGRHPEQERLYILNGLGTKGSSLAPWCATQMADLLLSGKAVDREVDIRRFGY